MGDRANIVKHHIVKEEQVHESLSLSLSLAEVHDQTSDGGWEIAPNVLLLRADDELFTDSSLRSRLTKNEARALAAVLLEFARER